MATRKTFLLRLPPELYDELNRWARDDLRSLNGQIEYLLREELRRRGRGAALPAPVNSVDSPDHPQDVSRLDSASDGDVRPDEEPQR